jgi:hypothetical protein
VIFRSHKDWVSSPSNDPALTRRYIVSPGGKNTLVLRVAGGVRPL